MTGIGRWIGLAVAVAALPALAGDPWQHITRKDQPLLPGDEVQLVKLGKDKGPLWIGTLTGVAKVEAGVLRRLPATKDLKAVWDVTDRPEGGVWIGHSQGALLLDGDRAVPALAGQSVAAIQLVGTKLWALAKDGNTDKNVLLQNEGDNWVPVAAFKDRRVEDLRRDAGGTFWLVLDGDGVIEIEPQKPLTEARHHLPRLQVKSIMRDAQGLVWCGLAGGGANGVMVRQNNEWKRYLPKETSAVLELVPDRNGKVWAATSGNGIQVFDGKNWTGMLQDEGLVSLLKLTSDGRLWVSTQRHGGLRYWDGKEWKTSLEGAMPVRCLTELPNGVLVAGGVLDGLYVLGNYPIKGE